MTPAPKRRWFRYSLRTLFVVVTVFAVSYVIRSEQESSSNPLYDVPADERPPDVERDKIEALAIAAVVKKEAMKPSEFYVRATREGDDWSVHVQYLPLMPGNFSVLRMSAMGEVLEWLGGA